MEGDLLVFHFSILITKVLGDYAAIQSVMSLVHFTDMLIQAMFFHPLREM